MWCKKTSNGSETVVIFTSGLSKVLHLIQNCLYYRFWHSCVNLVGYNACTRWIDSPYNHYLQHGSSQLLLNCNKKRAHILKHVSKEYTPDLGTT